MEIGLSVHIVVSNLLQRLRGHHTRKILRMNRNTGTITEEAAHGTCLEAIPGDITEGGDFSAIFSHPEHLARLSGAIR